MSRTLTFGLVASLGMSSMTNGFSQPATAATPAANLLTSYSLVSPSQINWITCGSAGSSSGCYDSGTLGSLTNACNMMEGLPTIVTNTQSKFEIARPLYVMDAGATTGGARLNVYIKTDTIVGSFDTTTITLFNRISLPLTGGNVKCFMAGNGTALFLGTDQSTNAAEVTLPGLLVSQVGGFSPPINVSQISGCDNGSVAVSFGTGSNTGFIIFGPGGEEGGGSAFVVNNIQGIQLTPSAAAAQASRAGRAPAPLSRP